MRYLSVSSPGSFSVSVGASGELHGFTVQLLENSRSRLRARSFTLGKATVVIMRVGELDDMLQRMNESRGNGGVSVTPSPFSPLQHALMYRYSLSETEDDTHNKIPNTLFVVVGSDDGYSEETLLRIAALISELCLFLNIDSQRGGPNAPVLKQLLMYIETRLMGLDVSLLCQMIERLVRPAVIATGFASCDASVLLDNLAHQSFLHGAVDCRVPNYIAVLLGHKLVLETTPQWNEKASKACGIEGVTLHDSDRYLAYFVTCAFFSVPLQYSCYDVSHRERRICSLEQQLCRFGIHRHNVSRHAARMAVQTYAEALRKEYVNECSRALFFERAYEELLSLMSPQDFLRDAEDSSTSTFPCRAHNEYHSIEMDFDTIKDRTFQIDNICFRNSDFFGSLQLRWIPTLGLTQEEADSSDGTSSGNFIAKACPFGYAVCLLYLPPRTGRDQERQRSLSAMTHDHSLLQFTRDILGSMETSFNCFQWLLSPPVESYEIPGLIHFVAVDRRSNGGVVASFYHMMYQKSANVQNAVGCLKRLVALNISRSHSLLHAGYSEGLWGHFGMQFFYCVCTVDEAAAMTTTPSSSTLSPSLAAKRKSFFPFSSESSPVQMLPSPVQTPQDALMPPEDSASMTGAAESLLGSLSARRKLPPAAVPHLVLRPMLLPDFTYDEPEGVCLVEVYAVFVGTMSPAEVCKAVERLLRSRVLPSWGKH